MRNGELLLHNARLVSQQTQSGHIAASLLYDCFECLVTAAIAHAPDASIYDPLRTRGIHNRRREQFERLYHGQLPADHDKLSIIIKRRNAVRYIEPGAPLAPWEVNDFGPRWIARYVEMMERYLESVKQLLHFPYHTEGSE